MVVCACYFVDRVPARVTVSDTLPNEPQIMNGTAEAVNIRINVKQTEVAPCTFMWHSQSIKRRRSNKIILFLQSLYQMLTFCKEYLPCDKTLVYSVVYLNYESTHLFGCFKRFRR